MKQLAKWLGVGSSFFGGNQPVAYRLNKIGLPTFNAGKNPFLPTKPDAAAAAAAKVENKISAPVNDAPTNAAPVKTVTPLFATARQAPAPVAAKSARTAWTARLNPFRAPELAAPMPLSVQSELSLDTVKVVHNDLTDADVDIVPVKSHAAPATPVLPPARQAWEFLGVSVGK